MLLPITNKAL